MTEVKCPKCGAQIELQNEPATFEQLEILRSFGIEPRAGIDKKTASKLIKKLGF